ncbi:hypothetical protein RUM43_002053 [Polyplax serrata]|uniref:Uncharacterized protein n=1 Tax=Polyplax serrata TaxID=468196 RepID=A0AAN8PFG5_POLSC
MVVCCPDERFPLMEILFFVLFLIVSNCRHHCNGERSPKNREKVIEDYVLSAKFDGKPNLPQLRMGYPKKENNHHQGSSDYGDLHSYGVYEDVIEDPYSGNSNSLAERDLMVHHHHVAAAPPPPPPPIPPPPVAVDQRPAFFAVGLIAFLMLLNALQVDKQCLDLTESDRPSLTPCPLIKSSISDISSGHIPMESLQHKALRQNDFSFVTGHCCINCNLSLVPFWVLWREPLEGEGGPFNTKLPEKTCGIKPATILSE